MSKKIKVKKKKDTVHLNKSKFGQSLRQSLAKKNIYLIGSAQMTANLSHIYS